MYVCMHSEVILLRGRMQEVVTRPEGDLRDDSKKFQKSCDGILVRAKVLAEPLDQPDSVSPLA